MAGLSDDYCVMQSPEARHASATPCSRTGRGNKDFANACMRSQLHGLYAQVLEKKGLVEARLAISLSDSEFPVSYHFKMTIK